MSPAPSTKPLNAAPKYIPYQEVQKHNTRSSCWVIINGLVYDATDVLDFHPGGSAVILKNGGKDATKVFTPIHPPNTLSSLPPEACVGPVDLSTLPKAASEPSEEEQRAAAARSRLPPLEAVLNLREIEMLAETVLAATAWGYYRCAGDDESTFNENRAAFKRYWFRPRVLNKISTVSTKTTLIGFESSLPIYISPAALARLGHPDGEMNLTRGAGIEGIILGLSINASCSREEVLSVRTPEQTLFFQLYANRNRHETKVLIANVEREGFKAIIFTVDAPVPGKRERDQRAKGEFKSSAGPATGISNTGQGAGVAHAISGYQDPDICWEDIPWIQSLTNLPIIVKGIQCVEDAIKAFQYGVQAIILSNHGGRELDYSPAPLTVLQELHLRRPDLLYRNEVYIDGGIERGTDVLKALCLGARAVGLGRAFLYGNSLWGEAGVRKVIQIMREEIETGMRLLGVTSLDQLTPDLVKYESGFPLARL